LETLRKGFRFTRAERALLVSIFNRYDGKTPDRNTCEAIARAFTQSPVRCPRRRVARQRRQIASAARMTAAAMTTTTTTPTAPLRAIKAEAPTAAEEVAAAVIVPGRPRPGRGMGLTTGSAAAGSLRQQRDSLGGAPVQVELR
jgi:hypothetical protein